MLGSEQKELMPEAKCCGTRLVDTYKSCDRVESWRTSCRSSVADVRDDQDIFLARLMWRVGMVD